jgi:hypothetical protein
MIRVLGTIVIVDAIGWPECDINFPSVGLGASSGAAGELPIGKCDAAL